MRAYATGLAAAALCGCSALVEVPTDAATLDALRPRELTRVISDSGNAYRGRFFRVESDSLILLGEDGKHKGTRLGHIRSVAVWRLSLSKTAWVAGGVVAGIVAIRILFAAGVLTSVNEDTGPVQDPAK
jgi:hypothetical protein